MTPILTKAARIDMKHILSYTLRKWGERKAIEYRAKLDRAFQDIGKNPQKGREDFPGYRYIKTDKHVIFYKIADDAVYISRILHKAMNFALHLE